MMINVKCSQNYVRKMQPLPSENSQKPQFTTLFLQKLRKIVEDPSTDDVITWNPSDDGFVIRNQAKFGFQILPKYYNHSNLCSFIRQLNMYGFHKVPQLENRAEIEYTHPHFSKNEPDLMAKIERTKSSSKTCGAVLKDFEQIRGHHVEIDAQLRGLKQENALLWREIASLRQKHSQQRELVNKIIGFLVAVIQNDRGKKRRRVLEGPSLERTAASGSDLTGSAIAILDVTREVAGEENLDLQRDESRLEEFRGILDEWDAMADGGCHPESNNSEDVVLDMDQLIAFGGDLEAGQGKVEELLLLGGGSEQVLTEGPAYLNL